MQHGKQTETETESSGFHLHDAGVIEPSENREGWSMQKKK